MYVGILTSLFLYILQSYIFKSMKQRKVGKIYGLVCPIKKKIVYIGQTDNVSKRLGTHIRKTKHKLKNEIKLSKKEFWIKKLIELNEENNISVTIIEECELENLNEREIHWISEYGLQNLYNLTEGGEGTRGYTLSELHKKKISENRKGKYCGEDHWNYGNNMSEETLEKISIINFGENHWNYGQKLSEKTKKLISKANSGKNNGMYGKRFKKTKEQIEKQRNNMINSKKFQESRKSEEYRKKISDIVSIPVYILDENFEILMEFKNSTECAEYFGYTRGNVKNAIRDRRRLKRKYWVIRKENYNSSKMSEYFSNN